MGLENLLGRTLERIEPTPDGIQKLLEAARRNMDDATVTRISTETRFDAAYKAIMQLANAALQANGYRTLTSRPGHHQTMIQTLPLTIDLEQDTVIVLDSLRKQRNIADYSGDPVTDAVLTECLETARALYNTVQQWLNHYRPDLLS